MAHPRLKSVIATSTVALPLLLNCGEAVALETIELFGKHIFFDEKLSTPRNKQACASCHDPARGWVLPQQF
jgi:cytochrome c peroxidase